MLPAEFQNGKPVAQDVFKNQANSDFQRCRRQVMLNAADPCRLLQVPVPYHNSTMRSGGDPRSQPLNLYTKIVRVNGEEKADVAERAASDSELTQ